MSFTQVTRYVAVGVINTCTGLLVIYALKLFAGLGDVGANVLGYAVGMSVSFSLNRKWTFGYLGNYWASGFRFLVAMIVSYGLNLLTVLLALHALGLNSYVAQMLGVPPFTIASYLLCKYWVFNPNMAIGHSRPLEP
jgi:putative flippase GtrA